MQELLARADWDESRSRNGSGPTTHDFGDGSIPAYRFLLDESSSAWLGLASHKRSLLPSEGLIQQVTFGLGNTTETFAAGAFLGVGNTQSSGVGACVVLLSGEAPDGSVPHQDNGLSSVFVLPTIIGGSSNQLVGTPAILLARTDAPLRFRTRITSITQSDVRIEVDINTGHGWSRAVDSRVVYYLSENSLTPLLGAVAFDGTGSAEVLVANYSVTRDDLTLVSKQPSPVARYLPLTAWGAHEGVTVTEDSTSYEITFDEFGDADGFGSVSPLCRVAPSAELTFPSYIDDLLHTQPASNARCLTVVGSNIEDFYLVREPVLLHGDDVTETTLEALLSVQDIASNGNKAVIALSLLDPDTASRLSVVMKYYNDSGTAKLACIVIDADDGTITTLHTFSPIAFDAGDETGEGPYLRVTLSYAGDGDYAVSIAEGITSLASTSGNIDPPTGLLRAALHYDDISSAVATFGGIVGTPVLRVDRVSATWEDS